MKRMLLIAAAAALLVGSHVPRVCAGGCGPQPAKPANPPNCRDMQAQCVCDEKGANCRWVWVCSK